MSKAVIFMCFEKNLIRKTLRTNLPVELFLNKFESRTFAILLKNSPPQMFFQEFFRTPQSNIP